MSAAQISLESLWMPFTANRHFKANPRLLASAEGMYYMTERGDRILDGTAGLWCVNAGRGRRKIVEAVQRQAAALDYAPPFQMGHSPQFEFASRLAEISPGNLNHVFFTNSGSESVDTALKIAIELEPIPAQPSVRAFNVFLECYQRGLLTRTTGDTIALSPPLIMEVAAHRPDVRNPGRCVEDPAVIPRLNTSVRRACPCLSDVVVGGVLVAGAAAPKLVSADLVKRMKPGSALVDVSIDQGGCFETSRPTTHADPTYLVDEVVHYCVANMPGAVPRTSTYALNNVTLPFVTALADNGYRQTLLDDPHLRRGLNVYCGKVTYEAVANGLGYAYL